MLWTISDVEQGVFRPLDAVMLIGWVEAMTQYAIILHRAGRIGGCPTTFLRHTTEGALRLVGR